MKKQIPSMDQWLKEAKAHESAPKIGMYLTHNGTVRQTAKAKVRYGAEDTKEVTGKSKACLWHKYVGRAACSRRHC